MKTIKPACDELAKKIKKAEKELQDLEKALKAMQSICEHDWQYDGHGHNDDHYVCSICKAGKWE